MRYFILLLFPVFAFANNVEITNVDIVDQNSVDDYTMIQFDINWENSWRVSTAPNNWDACWIFVKYRFNRKNPNKWYHATLNYVDGSGTADGHQVPTNGVLSSADDTGSGGSRGVFLYHDTDMAQGDVSYSDVKLRWNYGVDGVADYDSMEVRVFAIEMVYIPESDFHIGSGGTEANAFYMYPDPCDPYLISSEDSITVGADTSQLYYASGGGDRQAIPAHFPKGHQAMYCMKYEITRQLHAQYLNTVLPADLSPLLSGVSYLTGSYPNYGSLRPYHPVYTASGSAYTLSSLIDWAGLRFMTELEYEKICRGPQPVFFNEYAWGNNLLNSLPYSATDLYLATEEISNNYDTLAGNAVYSLADISNQPSRVGIFASNTLNKNRMTAGASYYGVMEMSGNVFEYCVPVGKVDARAYNGTHGDGNYITTPATWLTTVNLCVRGGSYGFSSPQMRVSDRTYTVSFPPLYYVGARGVRTAP